MDISQLTIQQAREIAALFAASAALPSQQNLIAGNDRKVIVRSRDAGVQYGSLVSYSPDGSIVNLKDARQMWSWAAKEGGTLFDCATLGVKAGKFSSACSAVTVIGACAIIDVTPAAAKTLEAQSWA